MNLKDALTRLAHPLSQSRDSAGESTVTDGMFVTDAMRRGAVLDSKRTPSVISAHWSVHMLDRYALDQGVSIRLVPLSRDEARHMAMRCLSSWSSPISASGVGYANTADVLTSELGVPILQNRTTVLLGKGETMLLCALEGARLPEFTTTLPPETSVRYFLVEVQSLDGED